MGSFRIISKVFIGAWRMGLTVYVMHRPKDHNTRFPKVQRGGVYFTLGAGSSGASYCYALPVPGARNGSVTVTVVPWPG